jgi:hypothetical protein
MTMVSPGSIIKSQSSTSRSVGLDRLTGDVSLSRILLSPTKKSLESALRNRYSHSFLSCDDSQLSQDSLPKASKSREKWRTSPTPIKFSTKSELQHKLTAPQLWSLPLRRALSNDTSKVHNSRGSESLSFFDNKSSKRQVLPPVKLPTSRQRTSIKRSLKIGHVSTSTCPSATALPGSRVSVAM